MVCGMLHVLNRTDDCEPHVSVNVVRHEATIPIQICQLTPCYSRSSSIREAFSRFPVPLLSFLGKLKADLLTSVMGGVRVSGMNTITRGIAVCLLGTTFVAAEVCPRLTSVSFDELTLYLNTVIPNDTNSVCVTFAIDKLAEARHQPAIFAFTKLLDFRRPLSRLEKQGIYLHVQTIGETYPAVRGLEKFGKSASPSLLDVITARTSSDTARENAVYAWMGIYKHEGPNGVGLLKKQAAETSDPTARKQLLWAADRAVKWCTPRDAAHCKAAARGD